MARSFGANSTVVLAIIFFGCLFAFSLSKEVATKLGTLIGIDLGTTYSCVGVYKNDHAEIIVNDQGNRITPSWVGFTDCKSLIGEAAKNQAAVNPERTIFDVKFEDKEVQKDRKLVPYQIVNKDGKPYIQVKIKDGETRFFSPEEISAMILTKMKETSEAYLGKKIKDAVPEADHQVSGQWVTFNRSVLRHITLPVPATGQGVEINASHDTGESLVAPSDGFLKVIWIMLQGVTMSMVSLVMLNAVANRVCHRNKQCDSSSSRSTRNTRKKKR